MKERIELTKSNRTFELWHATPSLSQILVRSPKDANHDTNIDLHLLGVDYIELATRLEGIEITEPTAEEIEALQQVTTVDEKPHRLRIISSMGHRFKVVSSHFGIYENDWETSATPIEFVTSYASEDERKMHEPLDWFSGFLTAKLADHNPAIYDFEGIFIAEAGWSFDAGKLIALKNAEGDRFERESDIVASPKYAEDNLRDRSRWPIEVEVFRLANPPKPVLARIPFETVERIGEGWLFQTKEEAARFAESNSA